MTQVDSNQNIYHPEGTRFLDLMKTFSPGLNQKFDSAEDIEPKLEGLVPGVTQVDLGGNSYGVGACKALADRLAKLDTLEVANLDDMFTGRLREEIPQSMDDLLTALLNCKHLHTVNLSDNAFGIATIAPLEKFLSSHAPLQHLILANNGFGPEAGARVGRALEALAEKKQKDEHSPLETVVCGRNRLENGSMEAWASFIKKHGTVRELRLYQNGIRQEGIEVLLRDGLSHSSELRKLDLQDNTFTERGSLALAASIDKWPHIEEIGISDCLLSADGSIAIAKRLDEIDTLSKLETLRLQYNEMDERGLKYLSSAVDKNMIALRLLELNGNRFSEDHAHVADILSAFAKRGYGELDDLDDMEEETDDEEGESEDDELESGARDARYAEDEPVAEDDDAEADDLASELAKVHVDN